MNPRKNSKSRQNGTIQKSKDGNSNNCANKMDIEKLKEFLLTKGDGAMGRVIKRMKVFFDKGVSPILLVGETGCGKEYAARALLSDGQTFKSAEYKAINCAAIPESLLETTLFGHRKGAFTDAGKDQHGLLGQKGGKVFLDEIDKASPNIQNKLLRYLREGTIQPVGSSEEIEAKASRIVFATSAKTSSIFRPLLDRVHELRMQSFEGFDLDERQERALRDLRRKHRRLTENSVNSFSPDFLNRVSHSVVEYPPLRKRQIDLGVVLKQLVRDAVEKYDNRIRYVDGDLLLFILRYAWPFNIAELESMVRSGALFSKGDSMTLAGCLQAYSGNFDLRQLNTSLVIDWDPRTGPNNHSSLQSLGVSPRHPTARALVPPSNSDWHLDQTYSDSYYQRATPRAAKIRLGSIDFRSRLYLTLQKIARVEFDNWLASDPTPEEMEYEPTEWEMENAIYEAPYPLYQRLDIDEIALDENEVERLRKLAFLVHGGLGSQQISVELGFPNIDQYYRWRAVIGTGEHWKRNVLASSADIPSD